MASARCFSSLPSVPTLPSTLSSLKVLVREPPLRYCLSTIDMKTARSYFNSQELKLGKTVSLHGLPLSSARSTEVVTVRLLV